jgi:hypothetical protein
MTATLRRLGLLVALAGLAAACAGRASEPGVPRKSRSHDEILMLHGKILDWRQDMGLLPTPDPRLLRAFAAQPRAHTASRSPSEPVPEVCRDTCNLADYICQAADDICRIAAELGDDAWAEDKCASASASCSEARKRCDECAERPAAGASRDEKE